LKASRSIRAFATANQRRGDIVGVETEAIMHKIAQAGTLALLAVLTASASARAETWCVRHYGDSPGYRFCAFSSAQDCLRAVFIGGSGICQLGSTARARTGAQFRPRFPDPPRLTAW
jgi:hypothetical protein